jgi:hypothetical protein
LKIYIWFLEPLNSKVNQCILLFSSLEIILFVWTCKNECFS